MRAAPVAASMAAVKRSNQTAAVSLTVGKHQSVNGLDRAADAGLATAAALPFRLTDFALNLSL